MTGENSPVVTRSAADFRMMRETLGLSQAWVARTVGVTTLTVVHWEDPREFALPRREAWDLVGPRPTAVPRHSWTWRRRPWLWPGTTASNRSR
mgnify:CR=1 FL=1